MSIILNGTTGITTPNITSDGSLKIDASAPAASATIDASGNLLVGTTANSFGGDFLLRRTSNTANLDVYAAGDATANNVAKVRLYNNYTNGAIGMAGDSLVFYANNISTERMRIDSAGRVTMPYQPYFSAYNPNSAGVAIPSGKVSGFSVVNSNVGGHYSGANSRFTAPVDGVYIFVINLFGISGDDRYTISVNGSRLSTPYVTNLHNGSAISGSYVIGLTAGDYVEVFAQVGGSSIYGAHSGWMGYLLG